MLMVSNNNDDEDDDDDDDDDNNNFINNYKYLQYNLSANIAKANRGGQLQNN
jgi:hypothetical protein